MKRNDLKAIAAVDKNWGIGNGGELLFRISEDLKRFKELTCGNVVIMGRKTLLTLPGGLPLNNRENIVFTRDRDFSVPGGAVCRCVSDLWPLLETPPFAGKDVFVIGGAEIYALLLPYCDTAIITKVNDEKPADRFFPRLDGHSEWEHTESGGDRGGYSYHKYRRT